MDIGMLHLHKTVIILFLLFFLFKTVLLFLNKSDLLERIRNKTKWVEMVLGVLILATGIYLFVRQEVIQTYLIVKFVLFLAAIPLGIIGLKRNKKLLAGLAVLLFIYIYGMSETKSPTMKPRSYSEGSQEVKVVGKEIYSNECARCHGETGNANLYGSKDLSKTTLSKEERIQIIRNGKNAMRAFEGKLTDAQIEAVAEYIDELKK